MMLTVMEKKSEGSGMEDGPGGAAAGRGSSSDATSKNVDSAEAGGHHGAEKRDRDRVARRRENPARASYGVGEREGGPKASGVEENHRGETPGSGIWN